SVTTNDAGTYCVEVTGFCTSVTNCAVVTIHRRTSSTPFASVTNCPGDAVTFTTTPDGTGPFTYVWRKNGAVISGATNSSFSIATTVAASAGTYCVEVYGYCNSVTNCATLTVREPLTLSGPFDIFS